MAVKYRVVLRKNPLKPAEKPKFYCAPTVNGEVDFEALCRRASNACTAHRGDVQLVVASVLDQIVEGLSEGNAVRLGELGSFRISFSSTGVDTEGELSAKAIKKSRIIFVPGKQLRALKASLSFRKVGTVEVESPKPPTGGGDDGGGDGGGNPGGGDGGGSGFE